jgi:transposase
MVNAGRPDGQGRRMGAVQARAQGRRTRVWAVPATLGKVTAQGDHLRCQGAEAVTIESTSDYRRVWHAVLQAAGLQDQLVNARAARNVPGRAKTDKKEAVWLAKLTKELVTRHFRNVG